MPDVNLERLRSLRRKAEALLSTLVADLKPFRHKKQINGFVRKPDSDSDPDDVNVTTSCSCLMALALTGKFKEIYSNNTTSIAPEIFQELVKAPWMSSGLSENNAFTTTLVLRTFGFLVEAGMLPSDKADTIRRAWEPHFQFKDLAAFAKKLTGDDPVSKFLFALLTRKSQKVVTDFVVNGNKQEKTAEFLSKELERIIGTTVLYEKSRFAGIKLRKEAEDLIASVPDGYSVARLNRLLIHDCYSGLLDGLKEYSLKDIAAAMSDNPAFFKINDYSPAAAVIYWFVDGVARANISLSGEQWTNLCKWATSEFNRERSLVLAGHDAMMDPVAMAMGACLCSRLGALSKLVPGLGANNIHLELLPSRSELEHSTKELFKEQTNGIWPKYFPLFHYQDAGSNFCFTFELLEAVLFEFGRTENELIDDATFVKGLENAVAWCEDNRLDSPADGKPRSGWNSGGYLETLKKGQPESWATAVVHMFLWELCHVLSARIQKRLLKQYNAQELNPEKSTIKSLISIVILEKGEPKFLNDILLKEFVEKYSKENVHTLRKRSIKAPRSALLFGPPGTSKTKVTEAIAGDLGWPLIQIDPSHFLENSLDGIYLQAGNIFNDLMDLAGVVVLFDEMDALVQTRDSARELDTAAQFLTTYMLPKLTALHDHGRLLFFMATNFQERFDAAIKRTGRFDLLLCMGPPTLTAKLGSLNRFVDDSEDKPKTDKENFEAETLIKEAAKLIEDFLVDKPQLRVQLELYTYGEFGSFVKALAHGKNSLAEKLKEMSQDDFVKYVNQDSKYVGLRISDLVPLGKCNVPHWSDWKTMADLDKLEFDRKTLVDKECEITPIIRYLLDRHESKQQG